jgi:hypothetical protein
MLNCDLIEAQRKDAFKNNLLFQRGTTRTATGHTQRTHFLILFPGQNHEPPDLPKKRKGKRTERRSFSPQVKHQIVELNTRILTVPTLAILKFPDYVAQAYEIPSYSAVPFSKLIHCCCQGEKAIQNPIQSVSPEKKMQTNPQQTKN